MSPKFKVFRAAMIDELNYKEYIEKAIFNVTQLPTDEIKYYLLMLINTLKKNNTKQNHQFLTKLLTFISSFNEYISNQNKGTVQDDSVFNTLSDHLSDLQNIARTHTFGAKLNRILLLIASIITATLFSAIGGLIGAMAGFARGVWNFKPITGLLAGLVMGLLMGGLFGHRIPIKMIENENRRQLKFGLDGLQITLFNNRSHPFSVYLDQVKEEIKTKFESKGDYERFLVSPIDFEINSFFSSFIGSSMLHKYAGHHAYIKININNSPVLIEYTPDPTDPTEKYDQQEIRTVVGAKIIEMLAYHKKMQAMYGTTLFSFIKTLKPGDADCFSYINKILMGTNQNATNIYRFAKMNSIGSFVGNFIEYLSPFPPDFYNQIGLEEVAGVECRR